MNMEENLLKQQMDALKIRDEILEVLISSPSTAQNNASIVITREMLPLARNYDIRRYVDELITEESRKKGYDYFEKLSDEDQLVFVMK